MKIKKISGAWKYFIAVSLVYVILLAVNPQAFYLSLKFLYKILIKILPIFVIIFILMAISNYFITPQFVMKHLGGRGIKKWFYVIVGGILSSGPIYMWYPLLANLHKKGLSYGLIACFLYNRAIKIPLLPIAVFYFSWKYILIVSFVMIFMSVVQGILINKIVVENEGFADS